MTNVATRATCFCVQNMLIFDASVFIASLLVGIQKSEGIGCHQMGAWNIRSCCFPDLLPEKLYKINIIAFVFLNPYIMR